MASGIAEEYGPKEHAIDTIIEQIDTKKQYESEKKDVLNKREQQLKRRRGKLFER